jgi:hypothetical protein
MNIQQDQIARDVAGLMAAVHQRARAQVIREMIQFLSQLLDRIDEETAELGQKFDA